VPVEARFLAGQPAAEAGEVRIAQRRVPPHHVFVFQLEALPGRMRCVYDASERYKAMG
jgi:hypothetical protein